MEKTPIKCHIRKQLKLFFLKHSPLLMMKQKSVLCGVESGQVRRKAYGSGGIGTYGLALCGLLLYKSSCQS